MTDLLTDLFALQMPSRDDSGWWVSKTHMTSYDRCPWAFWMVDSGQIGTDEIFDAAGIWRFLETGIAFESTVVADAVPLMDDKTPTVTEHGQAWIWGVPLVENQGLGIFGRPDGVAVEGGSMLPMEIKSHSRKRRTDELELCFYWDLLAPWRTKSHEPTGWLVLSDVSGGWKAERVTLTERRMGEMREIVAGVRKSRVSPPRARVCPCTVCGRIRQREVFEEAAARGDLSLIAGIGRRRAEALEGIGIAHLSALVDSRPADVATGLAVVGHRVSETEVARWIHHGEALITKKPAYFGDTPFDHGHFIAMDCEYDTWSPGMPLWLVGLEEVHNGHGTACSIWADQGDEYRLLAEFSNYLDARPDLPLITWAGSSADLVSLRHATQRWDMGRLYSQITARHIDLYRYVETSIRFPVAGLGLKLVAAQLGVIEDPWVSDGLDATIEWTRYCEAGDPAQRQTLKRRLIDYNRSDVVRLVEMVDRIRVLTRPQASTTQGRTHRRLPTRPR